MDSPGKRRLMRRRARDRTDAMPRRNRRQSEQASIGIWKYRGAGARDAAVGTGDVPGNEGVGEHVRTRFQPGFGPGEIAEQRFRTERRKPVSSAGPVLEKRTLPKVDPAV